MKTLTKLYEAQNPYTVTLSNDDMPFADDARYDKPPVIYWTKKFDDKAEAMKCIRDTMKEYKITKGRGRGGKGNGYELYANF